MQLILSALGLGVSIVVSLVTGAAIATAFSSKTDRIPNHLAVSFIGAFFGVVLALHVNGNYEDKKESEDFEKRLGIISLELADVLGTVGKINVDLDKALLPTYTLSRPTLQDPANNLVFSKRDRLKTLLILSYIRKDIEVCLGDGVYLLTYCLFSGIGEDSRDMF